MTLTKEDFLREIHIRIIFGCLYCSIISSSALLMYIFDIGNTNFILVLASLLGLPVILIGLTIRSVVRNYAIITKERLALNFIFIVLFIITLELAIMYFQNLNNDYVFILGTLVVFIASVVLGIIYFNEISKDWDFTDEEIKSVTG